MAVLHWSLISSVVDANSLMQVEKESSKESVEEEAVTFAFFAYDALRFQTKVWEESFEPTWKKCCVFVALFFV